MTIKSMSYLLSSLIVNPAKIYKFISVLKRCNLRAHAIVFELLESSMENLENYFSSRSLILTINYY